MKPWIRALVVSILGWLLGLMGTPSAAQHASAPGIRDDDSFGPRAMYFKPRDGDGSWYGGAQLRLHLSQVWALEGSADYRRETFDNRNSRADVFPVQASLLAYLVPDSPVTPFVLAGAGWYFTHTKGPGSFDQTQNRFGPHVGGGVELTLNQWWSLDASYRYVWVENIQSKNQSLLDKSYSDEGHMVTIGLNYHF